MKKFKTRIMLIVAALVLLLYFSSDFSLIDIQKTAIIVALGIDKKDDGFDVTVQIAVPQATDQTANNNDATITAFGKTVYEAIDNIGTHTGWAPKLAFCDLVLFGNSMTESDVTPLIDYLVASRKMQNSAILVACEKSAKDVLLAVTPLDAISSFAIQKILLKNPLTANNVTLSDIRKFATGQLRDAKTSFMPLVKMVEMKEKDKEGSGSSSQMASAGGSGGSGSSGDSSSSGGSGGEQKSVIFDASETAVFVDGKIACTLSSDETLAFNLITRPVEEAFFSFVGKNGDMTITINGSKRKTGISFKEKPEFNISLDLAAQIVDGTEKPQLEQLANRAALIREDLDIASQKFKQIIDGLMEKLAQSNADLFEIKDHIYKFHHRRYESVKELEMKNFLYSAKVQFKAED